MNLCRSLWLLAAAGGAGGLVFGYSRWVEPFNLDLSRKSVAAPDWPAALDGLTVLHLSDIHFQGGDPRTERWLDRVADLRPDLVLYTGDYIDRDADIEACALLARLRPRYGAFGVLGNHDRYYHLHPYRAILSVTLHGIGESSRRFKGWVAKNDVGRLVDALRAAGVDLLLNESRRLVINGQELWLVGVDDPYYRYADVEAAFRGVPEAAPRIVLGHTPSIARHLSGRTAQLILAGHTHGGQINLPGVGLLRRRQDPSSRHLAGLYPTEAGPLHVSRGVGRAYNFPYRLFCRPEAALLTLRGTVDDGQRGAGCRPSSEPVPGRP